MAAVESEVDELRALAALAEPLRRQIYELATEHPEGVTRDTAAGALGVARSVAAFHLDKLVNAGLLETELRRPAGRTGPGAGRPAKWYRRSAREVAVSIPERRYQVAAEVLASAADEAAGGAPLDRALQRAAGDFGRRLASSFPAPNGQQDVDRLVGLLAQQGYEPRREGNTIWLANCPFHALAAEHRQLVCGMNLDLLRAVAEAIGLPAGAARLEPMPGRCCVTLSVEPSVSSDDGAEPLDLPTQP